MKAIANGLVSYDPNEIQPFYLNEEVEAIDDKLSDVLLEAQERTENPVTLQFIDSALDILEFFAERTAVGADSPRLN